VRKFLIFLSGARPDILQQCSAETTRFEALGTAVLLANVLIAAGFAYASTQTLGLNPVLAVVIACAFGLALLSLDRMLITTTMRGSGRIFSALPRVLLAMLLGSVIGYGVVLGIFQPQINAQVSIIQSQDIAAFATQQANSPLGKQMAALQAEYTELQNIINTGGGTTLSPAKDPDLASLQAQLTTAQAQEVTNFDALQCQLYGVAPGGEKCIQGDGAQAQDAKSKYESDVHTIDQLQSEIAARDTLLTSSSRESQKNRLAQAKTELPVISLELDSARKSQVNQTKKFDAAAQADNGLLTKLQALGELRGSYFVVQAAAFLLVLLAAVISSLPVLTKVLQKAGPYEEILALSDWNELARARYRLMSVGQTPLGQTPLGQALDREPSATGTPPESAETQESANPQQKSAKPQAPRDPSSYDEEDMALRRMRDMRAASDPDYQPTVRRPSAN
jgi:hypothetical protein